MAENNIQKKTRGRQKVAMARMEKETNRLVTFSKRRAGLFKKASELCTLCGVQAAIIVFSPGRKVFSFGHPSVDDIINRYIMGNCFFNQASYHAKTSRILEDPRIVSSNKQLTILHNQTELEKKQTEEFLGTRNPKAKEFKWLTPIEELGLEDLKRISEALDAVKNAACQLYRQLVMDANGTRATVGSAYNFPPEMVVGQNPMLALYGDEAHQIVVAPTNLDEGPNSYNHPYMMIPHPMGGFGDPSLTMGLNAISMNNAGPSMPNPMNDFSMPNPFMLGFPVPKFWPPYQGENNPMGGGHFGGHPLMAPLNMHGMNPMTGQTFSAMLSGAINPNGQTPPFNHQSGFGSDIERFY